MGTTSKKVASVVLSLTTGVWMSGAMLLVPVAVNAQTPSLQDQITALLAQITALQSQLAVQGGGAVATSCSFTKDLTLGSKGDDAKCLQQYLNAKGFKVAESGVGSPGNESTYFGNLTKAAVAKWQAANGVSPAAGYFGSISRAKFTSLAAVTPPVVTPPGTLPVVVVPGTGLAVSVASDSPASVTVPGKATSVTFLKFNVAGTGTVTNMTVKRMGAGATSDFSNVYLYDGETRLTSGRSLNSSSHEATFSNLGIAVAGVKTLTVRADMAAAPGAANRNSLAVSAISASVAVSGLPVTGNEMTMSTVTAGTITLTKTGSPSNPNIGQAGALVSQFRIDAASENMKLTRLSLFSGGTISKSNLANFVLKDQAGASVATAAGVSAKDLVVFTLSTPYSLLKGDAKTFTVYADIGGGAKSGDTVKLYIDEASDVFALGEQYGHGVAVTKTAFDTDTADHHVLTLQGATVTITFNGPNASDIKKNGKDLTFFDFSIASANNIEIRNLRWTVTASTAQNGPDDLKVVDVSSGLVVAGPKDDASGTQVFTDVFTIDAGQSRRFKLTGDTDTNWISSDAVTATLVAFGTSDIKNLDNNQFLATTEFSPSTDVAGNLQLVKAPTLEVNIAATPVSDSFVKGTQNVPFLGLSLRAIADDIKVITIKVSSSPASGTLANAKSDVMSLGLYDGTTQVGTTKSLTGTALPATATFSNLAYTIPKGQTKVLTVKANLSSAATANEKQAVYVADVSTGTAGTDIVANDSEGNEPLYTGNDTPNSDLLATKVTVLAAGSLTVAGAPTDVESKAGIIPASASKIVLGKFNFTSTNEALTVKKLKLKINNVTTSVTAPTSVVEIPKVYLYDGVTQLGSTSGYVPIGAGGTAGQIIIEDLGWLVEKNATRVLTVKADTASLSGTGNGTTGRSVYLHVLPSELNGDGFEATGAASTIYKLTGSAAGVSGNQKVAYKTYPSVATVSAGTALFNGANDLLEFTVTNKSSNAQLSWNVVSFNVTTAAATAPFFKASGSNDPTATFTLRDLTSQTNLTLGTIATAGSATAGQYTIYIPTEEVVSVGGSKSYRLTGTVIAPGSNSSISTQLVLRVDATIASIQKNVAWLDAIGNDTTGNDAVVDAFDAGFVWSDNSATTHSLTSTDWANSVYVDTFPDTARTRSN
ncbi:MAG: peptidoglycan-binding domain-containing protein [bacterium]|nr:peptidoglycan-binding domain-containing protein [bacterium]